MYKEYFSLFFDAIRKKNLPTSVKIIIGVTLAYFFLPTDFIPDFGFPVGIVDDVVLAAIMIGLGGRIIYNRIKSEGSDQENRDDDVIDI